MPNQEVTVLTGSGGSPRSPRSFYPEYLAIFDGNDIV